MVVFCIGEAFSLCLTPAIVIFHGNFAKWQRNILDVTNYEIFTDIDAVLFLVSFPASDLL
jgi:hypothetical protein